MKYIQDLITHLNRHISSGVKDINTLLPYILETDVEKMCQKKGPLDESLNDKFEKIMGYRIEMLRLCKECTAAYSICFIETIKTLAQIEIYGNTIIPTFTKTFVSKYLSRFIAIKEEDDLFNSAFLRKVRDYYRFGDTKFCDDEIVVLDMSYTMQCKIRSLSLIKALAGDCVNVRYNAKNLHFLFRLLFEVTMITPNTQFRNGSFGTWDSWHMIRVLVNADEETGCKILKRERIDELIEVIKNVSFIKNKHSNSKMAKTVQDNILWVAIELENEDLYQILYEKEILNKGHIEEAISAAIQREQLNMIPILLAIQNA